MLQFVDAKTVDKTIGWRLAAVFYGDFIECYRNTEGMWVPNFYMKSLTSIEDLAAIQLKPTFRYSKYVTNN